MSLLLCAQVDNLGQWQRELAAAFPGETIHIWPEVPDPAAVRIALVARPPAGALASLPNLELICSLWAGVDRLLADPTLPRQVPLTRLIDPQLTGSMVESVLLHVLTAHRQVPRYRLQQARAEWKQLDQPGAADRTIGILGFGELGRACAEALLPLGFRVLGWGRSARTHPRVECAHGATGLARVLARADILVCLLPDTDETRGLLDATRLATLPVGATIINVGRGAVIDDAALLAALDAGRIETAILDVFQAGRHERVWVYPHVAAETDPRSAARTVADTVRRFRTGARLPERVDSVRGY